MEEILEIHDLAKSFGSFTAVKGVSFNIKKGEIFSLLGPNGAGKTTTISMLSCLLKPTRGDALVCGHSIVKEPLVVKRVIGVVPQEIALYDSLSARENLFFWGRMYGMGGAQLKKRVDEVLEQIGLADKAGQKVQTYSGGGSISGSACSTSQRSSSWMSLRSASTPRAAAIFWMPSKSSTARA
jgi:ABC-2 type transport system ATP-binding protein